MVEGKAPVRIGTPTEWLEAPLPELDAGQRWAYHVAFTATHEAGHAIAMRLAGEDILDVRIATLYHRVDGVWGKVRNTRLSNLRSLNEVIAQEGRAALFKAMVSVLAGPAAEICLGGHCVGGGMRDDYNMAVQRAKWFECSTVGVSAHDALQAAWEEAHRMVADPRVWAVIQAIATEVSASDNSPKAISGDVVHSFVGHHLPDGWAYQLPAWAV